MSQKISLVSLGLKLELTPDEIKEVCGILAIPVFNEGGQEILKSYQGADGKWLNPTEALTKLNDAAKVQNITLLKAAQEIASKSGAHTGSQAPRTSSTNAANAGEYSSQHEQYQNIAAAGSVQMIQDVGADLAKALEPVALILRIDCEIFLRNRVLQYMSIPSKELSDPRLEAARYQNSADFFTRSLMGERQPLQDVAGLPPVKESVQMRALTTSVTENGKQSE